MRENFFETLRNIVLGTKTYIKAKKIATKSNNPLEIGEYLVNNVAKLKGKYTEKDVLFFVKKTAPTVFRHFEDLTGIEKAAQFVNLISVLSYILAYEAAGRITFRVRKRFVEVLKHTDFPEDVKLNQIAFPFSSFALEIEGESVDMEGNLITSNAYVFVDDTGDGFYILLSFFETIDGNMSPPWNLEVFLEKEDTLGTLFERLREENIKKHRETEYFGRVIGLLKEETKREVMVEMEKGIEDNIRVFINLLLYINHINEDVVDVSRIPEKLRKKKEYYEQTGNEKKLKEINRQLSRYARVYLVGERVSAEVERELKKSGSPKRPHWRRGHIRRYDPNKPRKRKFKKEWTFVRPTLVKGGSDEAKEYVL